MTEVMLRLLTIAAVLLMSFGMGIGAAPGHATVMVSASEHCSDQPAKPSPADSMDHASPPCALACAALPAAFTTPELDIVLAKAPLKMTAAHDLHGVVLEIATPPPKRA
jgi:hypothetical protein